MWHFKAHKLHTHTHTHTHIYIYTHTHTHTHTQYDVFQNKIFKCFKVYVTFDSWNKEQLFPQLAPTE